MTMQCRGALWTSARIILPIAIHTLVVEKPFRARMATLQSYCSQNHRPTIGSTVRPELVCCRPAPPPPSSTSLIGKCACACAHDVLQIRAAGRKTAWSTSQSDVSRGARSSSQGERRGGSEGELAPWDGVCASVRERCSSRMWPLVIDLAVSGVLAVGHGEHGEWAMASMASVSWREHGEWVMLSMASGSWRVGPNEHGEWVSEARVVRRYDEPHRAEGVVGRRPQREWRHSRGEEQEGEERRS